MNSIHPPTFSNFYHPDYSGRSTHAAGSNSTGNEICCWITNGYECGRTFTNAIAVGNHIEIDHLSHNAKKCFWRCCGEKFKTIFDLKAHIRSHTNVMAFICGICKKRFEYVENLNVHMVTHEDQLSFDCTHLGCGRSFDSQSSRQQHMHVHSTHTRYFCNNNEKLDTGKLTSANNTVSFCVSNGTPPPVLKKQDMSMREFIKWSDGYISVLQNPFINSRHQFEMKDAIEDDEL
ncbi:hypothetical protein GCK72_007541 [Caenorhabditis remanei]|uniref:C2H2-type domain-containing protein n=1 Tax=Caenorhabditis remanei TaxID=31234 RepID=A0A6A5HP53_CAERE|nr:hypothetical protein GCK72_007541 [Caenorhabditis remanei]KAF1767582.1 hypothetical protein GCK72_007541 [Caenorhabditis remanei]